MTTQKPAPLSPTRRELIRLKHLAAVESLREQGSSFPVPAPVLFMFESISADINLLIGEIQRLEDALAVAEAGLIAQSPEEETK